MIMNSYIFEPLEILNPPTKKIEIENEIEYSIPHLIKNLDQIITFLSQENNSDNNLEVELPILDMSITYKISFYFEKLLISVLRYDSSELYGHIILSNYDCLKLDDIKKLGDWRNHNNVLKRYLDVLSRKMDRISN